MDPEPGRCRRTDGKKWRCRRDVVPNTKYCERHTNRGRSRKLVETAEITPQSNTPPTTSSHSNTLTTPRKKMRRKTIKPCNSAYTSAKLPTPIPENHQSKILSLNRSEDLTTDATITTPAADGRSKTDDKIVKNDKSFRSATSSASNHNDDNIGNCLDITPGTATAKIDGTDSVSVSVIAGDLDVRDAGSKCSKDEMNKRNSSDFNKNGGSMIPEVSTTSKTVVDGDTIVKENNPVCIRGCVTAEELHRCKRTDGKRWRCSREAIPGEKYCDSHMHRGSKRLKSEGVTVAATHIPVAIPKSDHKNVSTDLSISLGKSPEPITIDLDSSTSGRSSDSTTVTDTSASQFMVRPRVSLK